MSKMLKQVQHDKDVTSLGVCRTPYENISFTFSKKDVSLVFGDGLKLSSSSIFSKNWRCSLVSSCGVQILIWIRKSPVLYNELAKDKDNALGAYYQALYHTSIGDHHQALSFLEEAVAKGYKNKVHLTQEELLAPLHNNPRYQAVVEKLSKEKENKK